MGVGEWVPCGEENMNNLSIQFGKALKAIKENWHLMPDANIHFLLDEKVQCWNPKKKKFKDKRRCLSTEDLRFVNCPECLKIAKRNKCQ